MALEKWNMSGNCYGMTLSVALHKMGILDKEAFSLKNTQGELVKNGDPLFDITKESAEDMIHLYQVSQFLSPFRGWFLSQDKMLDKLIQEAEKMSEGGPPVLIRYLSPSVPHAVLAHRMEREGDKITLYFYDSNRPLRLKEDHMTITSTGSGRSWEIGGSFPARSDQGHELVYVSTGDDLKNKLDIFKGQNPAETLPAIWLPQDGKRYALTDESGREYKINARTMEADGLPVMPECAGEPTSFSVLLPRAGGRYRLRAEGGPGAFKLIANFPEEAYVVEAASAETVEFDANGSLSFEGGEGRVRAELLRDRAKGREDLGYRIEGVAQGDVALHHTDEGLRLDGTLDGAKVSAFQDGDEKRIQEGRLESGLYHGGGIRPSGGLPFNDVSKDAWYYKAVDYVYREGLMAGVSKNRFVPTDPITRAQMAQIIYNAAGKPEASERGAFNDVRQGDWYYQAVNWVADKGWMKGYGNKKYGPNEPIRRQDVAVLFHNMTGKEAPKKVGALENFRDRQAISPYAHEAMTWAIGEGIFKGNTKGELRPTASISRAEMAQVLMNRQMKAEKK